MIGVVWKSGGSSINWVTSSDIRPIYTDFKSWLFQPVVVKKIAQDKYVSRIPFGRLMGDQIQMKQKINFSEHIKFM